MHMEGRNVIITEALTGFFRRVFDANFYHIFKYDEQDLALLSKETALAALQILSLVNTAKNIFFIL